VLPIQRRRCLRLFRGSARRRPRRDRRRRKFAGNSYEQKFGGSRGTPPVNVADIRMSQTVDR